MLTGFDHITIAVHDLDAAVAGYQTLLGRAPVWRGEHPELGTVAALFSVGNALIELVGPRPNAAEAEGLREWLKARGDGMQAIAFATGDAAVCSAGFRQRGLRATAPQAGEARSAGGEIRSYRTVELSTHSTRGLSVFAVERPALSVLRTGVVPPPHAGAVPAADAVDALDHVVIRTADPDAAVALYNRGLGLRLALDRVFGEGRRMLFFRIGGVTIEIVQEPALGESDVFYGVAYRVRDISAANARMRAAGLQVTEIRNGNKPGTQVYTVRDGPGRVPTLILRDPTRD